jgi:hypothetical protein
MTGVSPLQILIGGKTYRVRGIGLEVQFAAADRIRALHDAQFDRRIKACATLEGEALHRALELAFAGHQKIVTDAEVLEWMQTLEGTVFILWSALAQDEPELSEKDIRDLYLQLSPVQLSAIARFFVESVAAGSSHPTEVSSQDRGNRQ